MTGVAMSGLAFWAVLSALLVSVMWIPYIIDRIMVRGLMGAMANPSSDETPQSPWAQRQKRAHTVGVETMAAFGPIAVFAYLTIPEDGLAATFAASYFFGLLAHYVIYTIGVPVARTLAFAVASLSILGLGLRVLGAL